MQERLQKILAASGVASRRKAEEYKWLISTKKHQEKGGLSPER